jgi:hypothetical protein
MDGIADKDKIKTTVMQGETAKTIKKNHGRLESDLQKAGIIAPPIPKTVNYE